MKVPLKTMRAYLNYRPLLRFAWQTIKSMAAIIAIFSLLAWVPEQPADRLWLFIYLLPVIFGGIIWFLVWLWRRHGGSTALSVIAAVLVLSGVQYAFMRRDADIAVRAVVDHSRGLEQEVKIVDLSDHLRSCDHQLCVEVLAETQYDILLKDGLYRIVRGEACYAPAFEASRFRFLKAGYIATCHVVGEIQKPSRLLVIEDTDCRAWENEDGVCGQLPDSFGGRVVTVRVDSPERPHTVRRWLEGGIYPINGWFAFVGLEFISVGKWQDLGALLTRALDVKIRGYGVDAYSDIDHLLTELEVFLDHPMHSDAAVQAFWDVSYERGRDNQDVLKAHIRRLIAHEDHNHILAGLNLITPKSQVDVRELRQRFVELSQSSDSHIRGLAERALRHVERRSFAN
jgi:hypothetical protein